MFIRRTTSVGDRVTVEWIAADGTTARSPREPVILNSVSDIIVGFRNLPAGASLRFFGRSHHTENPVDITLNDIDGTELTFNGEMDGAMHAIPTNFPILGWETTVAVGGNFEVFFSYVGTGWSK